MKPSENIENCNYLHLEDNKAKDIKEKMPAEEKLTGLAELYKGFSDSTRIKILYLLLQSELCVCDIAGILSMSQSAISHQLKVLKVLKLVTAKREGKAIIYSLADAHVHTIIEQGLNHINE